MAYFTLAVTSAVIEQVKAAGSTQRQIAIRDASPELLAAIRDASKTTRVPVVFDLSVGDTTAIWGRQQREGVQAEDFTSLYDLLARRPDRPVKFEWE